MATAIENFSSALVSSSNLLLSSYCSCFNRLTISFERSGVTGTLVPGHEVRSFSEEGRPKSYWVVDKTGKLMSEYKKAAADSIINATPVLAELTVEEAPQMPDGFGADYDGTYNVLKIASITPLRVSLSGSRTEPVPGLPRRNRGLAEKRRPGVFHQYGNTAISKMAARRKQTHFVGKKHRQPSNN